MLLEWLLSLRVSGRIKFAPVCWRDPESCTGPTAYADAFRPTSFLVVSMAGWMNQCQQHVIAYLMRKNRVLREHISNRRMRFSDEQAGDLQSTRRNSVARSQQSSRLNAVGKGN